eukprot:3730020-Prymnesium_polylepis.1
MIAHVRWFDTAGLKHDMARAAVRDVHPPPDDAWVAIVILASALALIVFGGGSYALFRFCRYFDQLRADQRRAFNERKL